MKDPIKLIALDMDGTLLRSDKSIDPETVSDIGAAAEKGIAFAYCTGRGIAEMYEAFEAFPMIRYAILNSGSFILDREKDLCLYRNGVERSFVPKITETAERYQAMVHYLTVDESIVSAADVTHMADFYMGVYQPMFLEAARHVEDMTAEGLRHESIAKINIYFRSVGDRSKAFEELKDLPIRVAFSENTTMEMTAEGVNKGTGLERLAAYLGISMGQTAAMGDNYNDCEMLAAAGFPVAMGNAVPELKAQSAYITEDNDHNGVGSAVRHILQH